MRFETGVVGATAFLQGAPDFWSYSSLNEIESCPRRYALSRARYPDLWDGAGYPPRPAPAALFGDVVHGALDTLVKALAAAGCTSTRTREAFEVIKALGGYSAVVADAMARRLERLVGNPRISATTLQRTERLLRDRTEEARAQVQEYLSRVTLPAAVTPLAEAGEVVSDEGRPAFGRRKLSAGAHPEAVLADEHLRLMGRIDLLKISDQQVAIVDYKTGGQDPRHLDQLRMYALLWEIDRVANPNRRPVTELSVAYSHREVTMTAADIGDLHELKADIRRRITAADDRSASPVPEARPSPEMCVVCPVRGICNAYWSTVTPNPNELDDGTWFDFEAVVGPANGVRSRWMLHQHGTGQRRLLLRTTPTAPALLEGTTIRVLGARFIVDSEVPAPVAVLSASAELVTMAGPTELQRSSPTTAWSKSMDN